MKKIFTIIVIFVTYLGYAQVPTVTYDPTQAANMGESISTALDQLDELEKMTNYYEKAQDQIQKVNKVILRLQEIRDIAKMHREILNDVNKVKQVISKLEKDEYKELYTKKLMNILKTAQKVTQEISAVTKDNYLNMTDKERMDFIKEKEMQMRAQRARIKLMF
ncbi:hypothetical protein CAPN002_26030 [Capnocytophaga stomatis]|uniref:hypothetical protein n=1 Tax=Capnocytophaga stomatis TaxID=1848904 RepID=UPI00194F50A4|nr:hypothetical protein [Capnocytophaga stomatis]GIJ95385.1 hypothetical protein CAPN002_26030 [Capnocytophaga stomatis]